MNEIPQCIQCHNEPVFVKKRGLGEKCYQKFYRDHKGTGFKWTPQQTLRKTIKDKYGPEFFTDLIVIKNYSEIGRK